MTLSYDYWHLLVSGYPRPELSGLILPDTIPEFVQIETAEKEVQVLPAGGLGVSPSFKKSPKIGGLGG